MARDPATPPLARLTPDLFAFFTASAPDEEPYRGRMLTGTLHNDDDVPFDEPSVWVRYNAVPVRLGGQAQLEPGDSLRGSNQFPEEADPPPDDYYARIVVDGVAWRVTVDGPPTQLTDPVPDVLPEGLPEPLPADIGGTRYVVAFGRFARAEDLKLDDLHPFDEFDEGWAFAHHYASLSWPALESNHHFLFGEPGVLFDRSRFLYHYTSCPTLGLIAASGSLRLGPFSGMNDPREARTWEIPHFVQGKGHDGPTEADQAAAKEFVTEMDALRRRTLMIAFGRDEPLEPSDQLPSLLSTVTPRGYVQPRMWAQYGNSHTGACIILDRHRFDESARATLLDGFVSSGSVRYSNEMKDRLGVTGWYTSGAANDPHAELVRHRDALFLKDVDWAGEHEYRWIYLPDDSAVGHAFVPVHGAVIGLVVGDLVDATDLDHVRAFVNRFEITANVGQCCWNHPDRNFAKVVDL